MGIGDLARYLGYEVVFVVGPGWLLLRAIAPGVSSRGWQIALGWPIGLTLEILAFSLTAGLGVRDLFLAYPLAVAAPSILAIRRRGSAREGPAGPAPPLFGTGWRWAIAGLCLVAFAYIGAAYFTITPLPGTVSGVVYPGDPTYLVSFAASALHQWPPVFPGVSGQPFHYHYFVGVHLAAISQVTGVHLPVLVFRLFLIPLTGLLLLELALVGRLIGGRASAGILTVFLFLFIREIDLSIGDVWPFAGIGAMHLWSSGSQLLGLVLFVPALVVIQLLLDPALAARAAPHLNCRRSALWVVLAILLAGAGGAKSVILPTLLGGLVLYLIWARRWKGKLDGSALRALGLTAAVFALIYLLIYRGSGQGPHIDPPATLQQMPPINRLHQVWPGGWVADLAFWIAAVPFGTLMYFGAPLLGLFLWLRGRSIRALEPAPAIAISILLVGIAAFFFLYDEFIEQTYFTLYGLVAIFPFAAAGLSEGLAKRPRAPGAGRGMLGLLAVAWVGLLVYGAFRADDLASSGHFARADLLAYGPALLVIALVVAVAVLSRARLRRAVGSAAVLAVLLAAALDTPLDFIPATVRQLRAGGTLYYQSTAAGVRPRTAAGMEWIRDHLPADAILAVSNETTRRTRSFAPGDPIYPALTERRTFREGWAYTGRANRIGQRAVGDGRRDPFPERTALERAVFNRADPVALHTMVERYGVTHIVVSRKDGPVDPRVYELGRLIYSNGAIDVIALPGPERLARGLTRSPSIPSTTAGR